MEKANCLANKIGIKPSKKFYKRVKYNYHSSPEGRLTKSIFWETLITLYCGVF